MSQEIIQPARVARETPQDARRRRITEAKRQFDQYLSLGAVDPAIGLHRRQTAAGEGWKLDPERLQPIVELLHAEKRWAEAAPYLVDLIGQLQQKVNGLRLMMAQIAVKKIDRPELALDALAALDHRSMTVLERDLALEMQGRARRMQIADDTETMSPPSVSDTPSG